MTGRARAGAAGEMPELWYIEYDLADGWRQREADYQLELLGRSLERHAAFEVYYAAHDTAVRATGEEVAT